MAGVIAESLAGKRIAITGATGFVGTALVERLLRSVPGCELVLVVRSGKRSPAARRVERELLRNDAFDRLRAECRADGAAESFEALTATADHDDLRRRGNRRPRPVDRRSGRVRVVRRRDPRRRRGVVRLSPRHRGGGQPARPDAHRDIARRARRHSPSRRRVDVLRRRQPPRARRPRSSSAPDRSISASTGGRRSPPLGDCAATPRPPAATLAGWPSSGRPPGPSSARPAPPPSPPRPSSCARSGCATG